VAAPNKAAAENPASIRVFLASSNPGKLREYRQLAGKAPIELDLIPSFRELPAFEESAPTLAENSAGKALHYSRFVPGIVLADDSGLVVPVLGGAPGVHSARYAGPEATDQDRVRKLLRAIEGKVGGERRARFVCVTAIARQGHVLAVVSDFAEGVLTKEPRGTNGFGYDPIFLFPDLGRTYAELAADEKNRTSHRGKAFRKALALLIGPDSVNCL
jgi:XTP/dITP diphosphohydrolase